jgi:hypothetical protein
VVNTKKQKIKGAKWPLNRAKSTGRLGGTIGPAEGYVNGQSGAIPKGGFRPKTATIFGCRSKTYNDAAG